MVHDMNYYLSSLLLAVIKSSHFVVFFILPILPTLIQQIEASRFSFCISLLSPIDIINITFIFYVQYMIIFC